MKKSVCFDLDGTLLDVRSRYYCLYREAVEIRRYTPLSQGNYFRCIRQGMKNYQIFNKWHDRYAYEYYLRYRNERIEDEDYLMLDKPFHGISKVLKNLVGQFSLIVLSNRDNRKNMKQQLERHHMLDFFEELYCAGFHKGAEGKRAVLEKHPCAFIVGDTEVDIETGRMISATAISVSWGLRHPAVLGQCHPHYLVRKPAQLIEFFGNINQKLSFVRV